jgi:GNAT superfamily N-acetyltransferase
MSTTTEKYHAEERLRDGRNVVIRAVHATDKPLLKEAMHHLSPQSLYFRFLTPKKELTDKELAYFTEVDFLHHVALMASVSENGKSVPAGVGRYVMADSEPATKRAEVAFAVSEEYQGLGIATLLLKHLTLIARDAGLEAFTALVLNENRKMLEVFKNCGLPMETQLNIAGVLEVVLRLK